MAFGIPLEKPTLKCLSTFSRVLIKNNNCVQKKAKKISYFWTNFSFHENILTLCFHTTLYDGGLAWTKGIVWGKKEKKCSLSICRNNNCVFVCEKSSQKQDNDCCLLFSFFSFSFSFALCWMKSLHEIRIYCIRSRTNSIFSICRQCPKHWC